MGKRHLMSGAEAMAEAAIRAGCRFYFGYPITPQSELAEYLARELPKRGGVFLQAESEIAAINMVFGASVTGARAMTSSSSPGISLKQEAISYMAGCELPGVIVNVCRGGPGLGNIAPSEADYFQAVKGGGHGDYRNIVLAPSSVQEAADLSYLAFDISEKYRNPVMILCSAVIAQMVEPVEFVLPRRPEEVEKPWALTGAKGREPRVIKSLRLSEQELEEHNRHLQEKYATVKAKEVRYETRYLEDAELVIVAFGTSARIVSTAVETAREKGYKVGLLRPITLFPFPTHVIRKLAERVKKFMVFEL
ncbi:MAG TPA: 3-methyl-2-oxobutanoate dehydrogenase subunit VorB, partial [Candidatus Avalokitesvara rifleensis]|uniref:3-methyl-2-oxobutanoate dehydrogenase subunit VorB n=1 Tax=Candidatus Avalokitesvara rifleensis TaxID=3367620 RepID=UPI004028DDAC